MARRVAFDLRPCFSIEELFPCYVVKTRASNLGLRLIWLATLAVAAALLFGCFANSEPSPSATEQRRVNFSTKNSMQLVEGVLRSDGILFTRDSDNSLTTLWSPADNQPSFTQSLFGIQPRYRYHVQVVPQGPGQSELVVSLIAENIPTTQLEQYQASRRLDLFKKFDRLAAAFPPAPSEPRSGGVIFSVLPNEDLKMLAKRATGNVENWRQIARDNGLSSPSQVKPFQTIWVRDSLLKPADGAGFTAHPK
jgi:hypothetical protein